MEGALRVKIAASTTTYKSGGTWHNVQSPGTGVTDGATYVFNTPTIVSSAVAAELVAFGVGTITTV
jgi:hypothetical protein